MQQGQSRRDGEIRPKCGWKWGGGKVMPCFVSCFWMQILVWHTRTEKPVLVNEGKKGFTDPTVEI